MREPLAFRMRPRRLVEFVGQEHLLGAGKPLRLLLHAGQLPSMILWGPPGCGKTTLAYVFARETGARVEYLSAVSATLEDLKRIIREAESAPDPSLFGEGTSKDARTLLYIDEIHRWNRAQQAALLPAVEEGTVIFIGATTENPYFEVISPLISRAPVYKLEALTPEHLRVIIDRALEDRERGLGSLEVSVADDAIEQIIALASGDARFVLNTLEAAALSASKRRLGTVRAKLIDEVVQRRPVRYDRDRDAHYEAISAFIKSLRGSDPDAAIFYLVTMLEAGEDPKFIARRMIILASEDIGNADPKALDVATAAATALEWVGLPEAEFNLAQATLYLATAPKSNAVYKALVAAKRDLASKGAGEVPLHLRNPGHPGLKRHQYGEGYQYPHKFAGGYIPGEQYLPEHLRGARYYRPTERGYERVIKARLKAWRKAVDPKLVDELECKIFEPNQMT